jgi:hypothetical protein
MPIGDIRLTIEPSEIYADAIISITNKWNLDNAYREYSKYKGFYSKRFFYWVCSLRENASATPWRGKKAFPLVYIPKVVRHSKNINSSQ